MNDKEILEKAIQKAIDGGWDTTHFDTLKTSYKHPDESEFHDLLGAWHNISPLDVIFNHDFAKALWGEGIIQSRVSDVFGSEPDRVTRKRAWTYHLQAMVISDDPIKYLGDNL